METLSLTALGQSLQEGVGMVARSSHRSALLRGKGSGRSEEGIALFMALVVLILMGAALTVLSIHVRLQNRTGRVQRRIASRAYDHSRRSTRRDPGRSRHLGRLRRQSQRREVPGGWVKTEVHAGAAIRRRLWVEVQTHYRGRDFFTTTQVYMQKNQERSRPSQSYDPGVPVSANQFRQTIRHALRHELRQSDQHAKRRDTEQLRERSRTSAALIFADGGTATCWSSCRSDLAAQDWQSSAIENGDSLGGNRADFWSQDPTGRSPLLCARRHPMLSTCRSSMSIRAFARQRPRCWSSLSSWPPAPVNFGHARITLTTYRDRALERPLLSNALAFAFSQESELGGRLQCCPAMPKSSWGSTSHLRVPRCRSISSFV